MRKSEKSCEKYGNDTVSMPRVCFEYGIEKSLNVKKPGLSHLWRSGRVTDF